MTPLTTHTVEIGGECDRAVVVAAITIITDLTQCASSMTKRARSPRESKSEINSWVEPLAISFSGVRYNSFK